MNLSTHEFVRQLKVLNPALRVCSFEGSNKLAGLHYIDSAGEYQDICGVDKNWVPEYTESDAQGHIIKSGWRRVYLMLVKLGLTTPSRITKVCPGFFLHKNQAEVDADRKASLIGDPIAHKIKQYSADAPRRMWRDPDSGKIQEGTVLSDEQNVDIAADIRRKDPQWRQEQDEKNRWFLTEWEKRGGDINDKPNY